MFGVTEGAVEEQLCAFCSTQIVFGIHDAGTNFAARRSAHKHEDTSQRFVGHGNRELQWMELKWLDEIDERARTRQTTLNRNPKSPIHVVGQRHADLSL